jgi:hypothetical protein
MDWSVVIPLLAVAALVGWQVLVSYQLLEILAEIKELLERRLRRPHHHADAGLTNYSTWTFRNTNWEIVESRAELGFVPGDPPRRPGAYEGETVRRPAVRGQ